MTTPLHSITFPEDEAGYDLRRVFASVVSSAHREGRLEDYCSGSGRVMRRLEIWPNATVRMLPE